MSPRGGRSKRSRSRSRSVDGDSGNEGSGGGKRSRLSHEERAEKELDKVARTLLVTQLTSKTDERDLDDYFSLVGKVRSVSMPRERSGRHKGLAYVEMADRADTAKCLLLSDMPPDFQKFAIIVKPSGMEKSVVAKGLNAYAQAKAGQKGGVTNAGIDKNINKLYLGNLHPEVTESILLALLNTRVGPVLALALHRDDNNKSRGFAFARFETEEAVEKAVAELQGVELFGRPLKASRAGKSSVSSSSSSSSATPYGSGSAEREGGNWRLDSGAGGASLDASSRIALMTKLGRSAGMEVPQQTLSGADLLAAATGQPTVPPIQGKPSQCFVVANMFNPADETEEGWDLDIKEDVSEECARFGPLEACHVEKNKPGGLVFLRFNKCPDAEKAAASLHGRYFAKRMITVSYFDPGLYDQLTSS